MRPKPSRVSAFRNCFGTIWSVSTLTRSSGATSPVCIENGCMLSHSPNHSLILMHVRRRQLGFELRQRTKGRYLPTFPILYQHCGISRKRRRQRLALLIAKAAHIAVAMYDCHITADKPDLWRSRVTTARACCGADEPPRWPLFLRIPRRHLKPSPHLPSSQTQQPRRRPLSTRFHAHRGLSESLRVPHHQKFC